MIFVKRKRLRRKKIGIYCGSTGLARSLQLISRGCRGLLPLYRPFCSDICRHINILWFIHRSVVLCNLSHIHSETFSSTHCFFPQGFLHKSGVYFFVSYFIIVSLTSIILMNKQHLGSLTLILILILQIMATRSASFFLFFFFSFFYL